MSGALVLVKLAQLLSSTQLLLMIPSVHSLKLTRVRRFLLIGVLVGLCFSFNASLRPFTTGLDKQAEFGARTISNGAAEFLKRALTNSIAAGIERSAPTPHRSKRSLTYSAALPPGKLPLTVAGRCRSVPDDAAGHRSLPWFSRPSGRGPPRSSYRV